MIRPAPSPSAAAPKRPWYAKRERFETPFARRMQSSGRRKALFAAVVAWLVAYPALLIALADGSPATFLPSVLVWTAAIVVLLTLSNMAIGGVTTIDPRQLDERELAQRDAAHLQARVISTAAVFVPIVLAPGLARDGQWTAVLALTQSVWFVHCFAPNLLCLWWQRDRPADPDLADPPPETEAPA